MTLLGTSRKSSSHFGLKFARRVPSSSNLEASSRKVTTFDDFTYPPSPLPCSRPVSPLLPPPPIAGSAEGSKRSSESRRQAVQASEDVRKVSINAADAAPQEHCFMIGPDPSAIPHFASPRLVIANGPPPSAEEMDWQDEATYQRLLERTTVRCVNILGNTALRSEDEEDSSFKLMLIGMHKRCIPSRMKASKGKGFYCCLVERKAMTPRACLAVYHVNPLYSSDLLYRVKGTSYDADEPLVAEQPEHILLAMVGRQMAVAKCLVGIITNGHLLVVVEATATNSIQASSLRVHSQAFIDCNASAAVLDEDVETNTGRFQAGLEDPPESMTVTTPSVDGRQWQQDAQRRGFERADMMFVWYAVMLFGYEQHLHFVLRSLRLFQLWWESRPGYRDTATSPSFQGQDEYAQSLGFRDALDLQRHETEVRQGVEIRHGSTRISTPAPVWLRPWATSTTRRNTSGSGGLYDALPASSPRHDAFTASGIDSNGNLLAYDDMRTMWGASAAGAGNSSPTLSSLSQGQGGFRTSSLAVPTSPWLRNSASGLGLMDRRTMVSNSTYSGLGINVMPPVTSTTGSSSPARGPHDNGAVTAGPGWGHYSPVPSPKGSMEALRSVGGQGSHGGPCSAGVASASQSEATHSESSHLLAAPIRHYRSEGLMGRGRRSGEEEVLRPSVDDRRGEVNEMGKGTNGSNQKQGEGHILNRQGRVKGTNGSQAPQSDNGRQSGRRGIHGLRKAKSVKKFGFI